MMTCRLPGLLPFNSSFPIDPQAFSLEQPSRKLERRSHGTILQTVSLERWRGGIPPIRWLSLISRASAPRKPLYFLHDFVLSSYSRSVLPDASSPKSAPLVCGGALLFFFFAQNSSFALPTEKNPYYTQKRLAWAFLFFFCCSQCVVSQQSWFFFFFFS